MKARKLAVIGTIGIVLVAMCSVFVEGRSASANGVPNGAKYVGMTKCRACHMKEYMSWKKAKHASVFDSLIGPEKKDPDCLKCHTTGYGQPSGYVSEEKTPMLKGVTCEACHGPGSEHVKVALDAPDTGNWDKKIDKVPQNACVKCHNPHINFKEHALKLRKEKGIQ